MKFKFLEEIATADVAFRAFGKNESELFENAALAVEETMVKTKGVKQKVRKEINLADVELDRLLFDFLSELVYLKDAETLFFSKADVKIEKNKGYKLKAKIAGETIDPKKHELRNDVKAVTLHMFEVKKTKKGFEATVILDI